MEVESGGRSVSKSTAVGEGREPRVAACDLVWWSDCVGRLCGTLSREDEVLTRGAGGLGCQAEAMGFDPDTAADK